MIEALDIKVNFAQGLIKSEEQINMIVEFVDRSKNLPPSKKSQILFYCANLFVSREDAKSKIKVIELLEKSTSLFDSEKQLEILGNMHLNVSESSQENKNGHIRQALRVFLRLLKTSQADNEYHLQSCLKVLGILFKYSEILEISEEFFDHFEEVPL